MSRSAPKSPEQLRGLARKAAAGPIHPNELAELKAQIKQAGPLGRQLKRIMAGEEE